MCRRIKRSSIETGRGVVVLAVAAVVLLGNLLAAIFTLLMWLLWTNDHGEGFSATIDEEMHKHTRTKVRPTPLDTHRHRMSEASPTRQHV